MPYSIVEQVQEEVATSLKRRPYPVQVHIQALREPLIPRMKATLGNPRQIVSIGPDKELGIYPQYAVLMTRDPSTHALTVDEYVALPRELWRPKGDDPHSHWPTEYFLCVGGYVIGVKSAFMCALFTLDLAAMHWDVVRPTAAYSGQTLFHDWPRPRSDPVCTVVEDRLVLFGGRELGWKPPNHTSYGDGNEKRYYRDTWWYDTDANVWTQVEDCPPHTHV
ncbi:hypothetical protein KIPB_010215 [Kipferlia bialata]|uniref:Uncharacterized protein n=1 Tax=Kipferlia bialata TaxID=797122 RepID=A0A391NPD7_9EUKA|nr:hypothetical protein KIPB_010215 [Kipferlia bialata]|eukprot:g10215.t1